MAVQTADQIYREALAAGWPAGAARIITAIALAESGGNAQAHNATAPDNSYGLTQINMIGGMGAPRRKEFGLTSNEQLYDPVTNLKAALQVYKDAGNSFNPWSTYTSGSYKKNVGAAKDAGNRQDDLIQRDPNAASDPNLYTVVTGSKDTVTSGVTSVTDTVTGAWKTVNDRWFWVRVAFIVGGLVIILIGIDQLTKSGTLSQPTPTTPIQSNGRASLLSPTA
jgi:hypothetical protein